MGFGFWVGFGLVLFWNAIDFLYWLSTSLALRCCWLLSRSEIMSCRGIDAYAVEVQLLRSAKYWPAVLPRRGFSSSVRPLLWSKGIGPFWLAWVVSLPAISSLFLYSSEGGSKRERGVHRSQHCSGDGDASVAITSLYSMTCVTEHLSSQPWKWNYKCLFGREREKDKAVAGSSAFCKN